MNAESIQQADDAASFALPVRSDATGFTLFLNDRGVTLGGGRIGWSIDGEAFEEPFASLSDIHLETTSMRRGLIPTCRLTFADGRVLRILAATAAGFPDGDQRRLYAQFIYELHRRLGAEDRRRIAFGCGYAASRVGMLRALALGGGALTLLLLALVPTGGLKGAVLAVALGVGSWRLWSVADANAPRAYDPDAIPSEMLPE